MKLLEFFGTQQFDKHGDQTKSRAEENKQTEEKVAEEVYWFILDDDELHKTYFLPLAVEMHKQIKAKKFDKSKYVKCWLPMVNKGCLLYYNEHKMSKDPKEVFPFDMRKGLCHQLADHYIDSIESNQFKLE